MDTHWDQPRGLTLIFTCSTNEVCTVRDPVGDHDTQGDTQLEDGQRSTSDFCGRDFGVVQWDSGTHLPNTKTNDESTTQDKVIVAAMDGGLNNDTHNKQNTTRNNSTSSTDLIGDVPVGQDPDPGTQFQDGRQQTLQSRIILDSTDTGDLTERVHTGDLTKHTLVVPVQETTQGGKQTDTKGSFVVDDGTKPWLDRGAETFFDNELLNF